MWKKIEQDLKKSSKAIPRPFCLVQFGHKRERKEKVSSSKKEKKKKGERGKEEGGRRKEAGSSRARLDFNLYFGYPWCLLR